MAVTGKLVSEQSIDQVSTPCISRNCSADRCCSPRSISAEWNTTNLSVPPDFIKTRHVAEREKEKYMLGDSQGEDCFICVSSRMQSSDIGRPVRQKRDAVKPSSLRVPLLGSQRRTTLVRVDNRDLMPSKPQFRI